jgi:hypothetical protein
VKRIALALIACAGLGFIAGNHTVQEPPAVRTSGTATPSVEPVRDDDGGAVVTPLVEKLLPKEKPQLVDGQLSPGKQWRWSESQWAWVPVKQAGPAWVQNGHSATIDHLVREHGYSRSSLAHLTQAQLNVLHSNAHNAARAAAPVRASGCPGGICPSPSRSRGLFGRRR